MKNNYIEKVRGFLIINVVLIHVLTLSNILQYNYVNIIIRKIINFSVPAFIFLAGYLVNFKDKKTFFRKKFFRLIPALILWDIIYFIIYLKFKEINFLYLIKNLIFASNGYHLYYIYVLIQLFIITPLLIRISKSKIVYVKYFPLLVTPIFNLIYTLIMFYVCDISFYYKFLVFGWISYFYLGLLLKEQRDNNSLLISDRIKVGVFALISVCEGIIVYRLSDNYALGVSQLSFINSIYSLFVCIYIYKKLNIFKQEKNLTILNKLGSFSFGIYLMHPLIINIVRKLINHFSFNYGIASIITYLFVICVCYIVCKIYYDILKGRFIWKK